MNTSESQDASQQSAMRRVFATAELLEMVLKDLSMQDLLMAESVCTTWASCIKSSPCIQEKLFLKPARPWLSWRWVGELGNPGNVLLKLDSPPFNPDLDDRSTPEGIYHHAEPNPLLLDSSRGNENMLDRDDGLHFTLSLYYPWPYKYGCFERMFVTQPPATEVTAELFDRPIPRVSGWERKPHTFYNPEGVRVGELIAEARALDDKNGGLRWKDCWFWASQRLMPTPEQQAMDRITDGKSSK